MPERKPRYLQAAFILALLVLCGFLVDLNCSGGKAMLPGELSSSHANFGNTCTKCHDTFGQVETAKCSACHEKNRESLIVDSRSSKQSIGTYSFQAHYVYRSDSLLRGRSVKVKAHEQPCRACHIEHQGRDFKLSRVTNARCADCHFEDFSDEHPNFQFARTSAADDSALKFTHIKHTRATTWRAMPLRATNNNPPSTQNTCAYCHEPEPDGKLFKPISFDRHCAACHLTNTFTPPMAIASKNDGEGVLTLDELREQNEVATQWARTANPNEFRLLGETRLLKRVTHRDPWVIYHLANPAGSKVGVNLGISWENLSNTANSPFAEREALAKLQFSMAILRMMQDSSLHAQLARVDTVLRKLQASKPKIHQSKNPSIQAPFNPLAEKIAKPCLECHMLSGAGLLWVNGEQEMLRRANFDHRAHLVQAQCLDCHFKIDVEKVAADTLLAVARDRASVQNLPEIDKCRQCHAEEKATRDCARCHEFHPFP